MDLSTGYSPRNAQEELHLNKQRFNVWVLHRRFGKCHTLDTLLYTKDGPVKISDYDGVSPVYGRDGKLKKVTGKYTVKKQRVYKVHFDSGVVVETNDEHLWYVEPPYSNVAEKNRVPWECGAILQTKQILESAQEWFVPICSAVEFPHKELEIDPWLFGYWLGNGDKGANRVCVGLQDVPHVSLILNKTWDNPGSGCVYFKTKILTEFRRKYDLDRVGKHIPRDYLYADADQRWELLRGLMDSDGTVTHSGTCSFSNKNERLVDDFIELVRSLGMKCSKNYYDRVDKGREFNVLFRAIDRNPFSLVRKANKVQFGRAANRHKIVWIEKTDRIEDMFCISLSEKTDKLYLTNGFITTHNTIACVNEINDCALRNTLHNPQYAYIGPNYSQTKRIAWEYMKQYTRMIPGVEYNESELKVTIARPRTKDGRYGDKITYYLLGAENPDSIRGIYLDGCVLDEYAVMHPSMWAEVVRPALMDRTGWAIFAGTPKGMNQFYDILQVAKRNTSGDWYWKIAKASETGILKKEDLAAAKEEMGEATYQQELECDFGAALVGAYYGKEMSQAEADKRITAVPYEPAVLVDTSWDLGISDTTVIWFFQQVGREIRVIDYVEDAGHGLAHYAEVLKKRGYKYGDHFFPHDVAARDLSTGKSREETLRSLGVHPIRMVPKMKVEDRINATRQLIPKVWIDEKKCARGIHALKCYERKWDEKNQIFLSSPLHNFASHGADSFGCYALGFRDEGQRNRMKDLPRQTDSDYDIFSR